MTDDDWEPLPSGDLCARPGEACELMKKVPQPQPPAPPPSAPPPAQPASPPPPAPPDPAAEAALAELKKKLAVAAPATSLIATVQHRELRAERKRKAPPAACAATVVRTTTPAEELLAAAEAAAAAQAAEAANAKEEPPDPREKEPWFRGLPESERERLRARWWLVQHRHDGTGLVLRLRLQRALVYGALCFFVVSLLQSMLLGTFRYVPIFVAAGALAAGIAEICRGGRIAYAAAGTAAFLVVMGPAVIAQPLSLVGLMIATYGMGTIGMDGEMRRSGGFPEK